MTTERRPDPDELLARVKEAETRQARGKLKIFFGAAAGVGKTYAMLEAAREQRAQGVDVVVGLGRDPRARRRPKRSSEAWRSCPAGRSSTAATTLQEFDLDAALRAAPR